MLYNQEELASDSFHLKKINMNVIIINAVTGKEEYLEIFFTSYVSMIMLLVVVVV